MFTTVNEEVAALETFWSEESDLEVLRARLTIRLDGLKARYRQGRPGFSGSNIKRMEALFEGLKLLDGLEMHLDGLQGSDSVQVKRHIKLGLRLIKLLGSTAVADEALKVFTAKKEEESPRRELGWHPNLAPLYGSSSLAMASATC